MNGPANVTLRATDNGNSGAGGELTARPVVIPLIIESVNDPPVLRFSDLEAKYEKGLRAGVAYGGDPTSAPEMLEMKEDATTHLAGYALSLSLPLPPLPLYISHAFPLSHSS